VPARHRFLYIFAAFALLAGLLHAQAGAGQLTWNAHVASAPMLLAEGFTERTADIVITCTGGTPVTPGNPVPAVDVTVYYNAGVTSRLLLTPGDPTAGYVSEALLLIDEPGSGMACSASRTCA